MSEEGDLAGLASNREMSVLEDLKAEREVFKEALEDSISRLNEINGVEQVDERLVSEIKELQFVIEPSLVEIKDLDVRIQNEIKELKLRANLVDEIKRSRSYAARIQVALNKAIELAKKGVKIQDSSTLSLLGGLRETPRDLNSQAPTKIMSPGSLFSSFPGPELNNTANENYATHDYGGRVNPRQVSFGQPAIFGQQDSLGQFGIFGQSRNMGQTEIAGQFGNVGQFHPQHNPFVGSLGHSMGNEMRATRNESNFGNQNIVKLPKLQLKRFDGDPMKWLEFWENFQRNVHDNPGYADVHKMSYLKACLDGAASTTIANLCIIGNNYKPAVEVLKAKYGQTGLLKGAHMAALKATQAVFSPRDMTKLRKFYEEVDSHYKALSVLGVPGEHYSVAVVPELMSKIPREIAINIRRSKEVNHEWMIGEFLEKLWQELVIRSANESQGQPAVEKKREGRLLAVSSTTCVFCLGEHQSKECSQVQEIDKRKGILKKYNRCFQCLRKGHIQRKCRDKTECDKCKKTGHHVSICKEETTPNLHVTAKGAIAYQTLQAKINIPGKEQVPCRLLLDTGSDKTYIVQKIADKLKGKPIRYETKILDTIHGSRSHRCSIYELEVRNMNGEIKFTTEAATLSKLTTVRNARPEIVQQRFEHLKDIEFSDVSKHDELEVHAIIGLEDLCKVKTGRMIQGEKNQPIAEETTLGWTLVGPTYQGTNECNQESSLLFCREGNQKISSEVERLWDLETVGIREDDPVHTDFKDTVRFNGTRYVVQLPWKSEAIKSSLPDNRQLSEKRLKSQLKRLAAVPEQLKAYDQVIQEQIDAGIVERVPEGEAKGQRHYIPHHAVIRQEAESTKVRIVFDASAKERKGSRSLNECLHKGPSLMPLLLDVLLRFRMYPVALVGDVKKAFHQIEISEEDRDSLRFLWVDDTNGQVAWKVNEWRFTRVIFGAGPSPFLLNATLRKHLESYEREDPGFVRRVMYSLFVDDVVCGASNSEEAVRLQRKLTEVMKGGGFDLHKWKTNKPEVKDSLENEIVQSTDETFAEQSLNQHVGQTKVLGIKWTESSDEMAVSLAQIIEERKEFLTKRELLSKLSQIYDPLGLVGPVTIIARKIFQDVCKAETDWDSMVSREIQERWELFVKQLESMSEVRFQRCVVPDATLDSVTIHTFADASKSAYCAAVYVVTKSAGIVQSRLLTAKTRLSPLKKELTIPRLELTAARCASRLMTTVIEALKEVEVKGVFMWTDSCTVLHWLERRGQYRQFVEHRITEIEKLTGKAKWGYCPTTQNPADMGTRGKGPEILSQSQLWWQGPEWLLTNDWPKQPQLIERVEVGEEEIKPVLQVTSVKKTKGLSALIDLKDYSTKIRLLRVTAWILRFVKNCRQKGKSESPYLIVAEVKDAEERWIKESQMEIESDQNYEHLVQQLNIVKLDGVMRCKGRLQYSDISLEAKNPVLLPRENGYTYLVVKEAHERLIHGGVITTLAEIRQQFWIPKGRQVVKKVIRQCNDCAKRSSKILKGTVTAPLPELRVKQARPFEVVGCDFAGPIYLQNNEKSYIALFTCAVTRAVHLELSTDMTALEFRAVLQRFMSRRGTPSTIISDNAKTFKSTGKYLKKICQEVQLQDYLTARQIHWKFNIAKAPWQGGFFERMVGISKSTLFKVLGRSKLSFREVETLLIQVEGLMNNRPLTYQTDELEDEPLTPNHMIFGFALPTIASDTNTEIDEDEDYATTVNKRLKYISTLKKHLWKRWTREYLQGLQEYHRQNNQLAKVPELGQIVLIVDKTTQKRYWRMGKVIGHIKSRDGIIRAVQLHTLSQGQLIEIQRPLQGITCLELKGPLPEKKSKADGEQWNKRTKRLATFAGEERRELQTEILNQED